MSLARMLKEFKESDLPKNKEEDIAEKSKFIEAIHEELEQIEALYLYPDRKDLSQALANIHIKKLLCEQVINLLEEYLKKISTKMTKDQPSLEYNQLSQKLAAAKIKSQTLLESLFNSPTANKPSENKEANKNSNNKL